MHKMILKTHLRQLELAEWGNIKVSLKYYEKIIK
jgi:hypothetical protein